MNSVARLGCAILLLTISAATLARLSPRPLSGEIIEVACFIKSNGTIGKEYKACVADGEKSGKAPQLGIMTVEEDVYVLVAQKGRGFEGLRPGDRAEINGMRTIVVSTIKKK